MLRGLSRASESRLPQSHSLCIQSATGSGSVEPLAQPLHSDWSCLLVSIYIANSGAAPRSAYSLPFRVEFHDHRQSPKEFDLVIRLHEQVLRELPSCRGFLKLLQGLLNSCNCIWRTRFVQRQDELDYVSNSA
jgi:hypothetical protein